MCERRPDGLRQDRGGHRGVLSCARCGGGRGAHTGLCIRKASLANGKKSWYIGARLGDAGNWLDSKASTVDRKMLWRRAAGDPHSPGLQRLKNWAGALLLNLPTPLSDGEEPSLVPLRPAEGARETRRPEPGVPLAGVPSAPTVCFRSTATQGDSCGPPARGGGGARGHLGVPVGGHRASTWSDCSRGGRATHSTWASFHLSPLHQFPVGGAFRLKSSGNSSSSPPP